MGPSYIVVERSHRSQLPLRPEANPTSLNPCRTAPKRNQRSGKNESFSSKVRLIPIEKNAHVTWLSVTFHEHLDDGLLPRTAGLTVNPVQVELRADKNSFNAHRAERPLSGIAADYHLERGNISALPSTPAARLRMSFKGGAPLGAGLRRPRRGNRKETESYRKWGSAPEASPPG